MQTEEEKTAAVPNLDPDLERAQPPLKHLIGFDEKELNKLKTYYNKTIPELEKIIDDHPSIDKFYYINFLIGNYGSCGIFLVFPIVTSNQGIQTIFKIISSNINVPNAAGYSIGGPLSVIEVVQFMFLFSARKEGKKATLFLSTLLFDPLKPFSEKLADAYKFTRDNPLKALSLGSQFLTNQSILLVCNLTGIMSELIYIPLDYSTWYARLITALTLYIGLFYFEGYTNHNYYEGLDFFFKDTKRPGLLNLMRDSDFVTPLQIVLQSASAVGLRVFPLYYFFSVESEQLLGWWFFNNYLVAALTAIQGVFILYPSTFDNYMLDYEKLKTHFTDFPAATPNPATFRKEFLTEHGYQFVFKKEKMTAALIGVRAFLGAYFGYSTATQFVAAGTNRVIAQVLCPTAGALIFAALLFSAELNRMLRHEHLKKLGLQEQPVPENPPPPKNKYSHIFAAILNYGGSFVGAMSTVGTIEPLIGGDQPEITSIITLLAIEQMINTIYFRREKVEDSVKDMVRSFNTYCGKFFKSNPAPAAAEPAAAPAPAPETVELTVAPRISG